MPLRSERLGEAGPDEGDALSAADARAQVQAAKAELARLLRERAALFTDTDREIARLVDEALARVTALLAGQPSDYQQWVLPRLVDSLKRIADELAASAGARSSAALGRSWDLGSRSIEQPLLAAERATLGGAGALSAGQSTAGMGTADLRQLRAMQQFTTHLIGGATSDTVNAINRQLGQVVLGVQQPIDAIRAVQTLLPERTKSQIRGIVNTQLAHAFNSASFQQLQRQTQRDPKLRKMWRRSGKRYPRLNHTAADGQVQEVGQPFVLQAAGKRGGTVELMFPCDPSAPAGEVINCGCVAIAWKSTWKMAHSGAKPLSAQELQDRAVPRPRRAAPAKPAADAPASTQATALAAFGARAGQAATLRDVTGQQLVIDERVFAPMAANPALQRRGRDLAAYWGVQMLRRPTEVWQTERIDLDTGEVVRLREFVKRFEANGQQWVALARLRAQGDRWVGERAFTLQLASTLPAGQRPGIRVWPVSKPAAKPRIS